MLYPELESLLKLTDGNKYKLVILVAKMAALLEDEENFTLQGKPLALALEILNKELTYQNIQ